MTTQAGENLMAHATQTIEVGSKSFAAAAKLFPPATRRAVLMLYAWCRHCDDVVDAELPNLYLVGAGTHPGAGVPGVIGSAKATAGLMLEGVNAGAHAGGLR